MEQRLADLFPDQVIQLQEYRSFVNQPDRIQISSQEDINDYDPVTLTSYYNFRVRLPRPALNVKSLQLARASIPNAVPNIPDTECTFWYYALPKVSDGTIYANNAGVPGAAVYTFDTSGNLFNSGTGLLVPDSSINFDSGAIVIDGDLNSPYLYDISLATPGNPVPAIYGPPPGTIQFFVEYNGSEVGPLRSNYLRYVRLVPSFAQPELMNNFSGGFNRSFVDYDDLVSELNNSTVDDPLEGEISNEVIGEFKFIPNQISFSYSTRFNKIIFTGLDENFSYVPAAADDPLWAEAAAELIERDKQNARFDFTGAIQVIQPFIPFRNLNMRLGFCYATYPTGANYLNMIRPIPPYIQSTPLLDPFTKFDHVAPGYADLVYSSCCIIYCDITGGSTVDSIAQKALLGSVPLNTPNLGVGFHSLPLNNPLTKIVNQIYEIYIELRTDTGQPFYLPNSAIVSLEFILTY